MHLPYYRIYFAQYFNNKLESYTHSYKKKYMNCQVTPFQIPNGVKGIPSLVIWTEQHMWPVFQEMKFQKLNVSLLMLNKNLVKWMIL